MSLTDLHESAAIGREQAAIRPHFYADDSQLLAITSLSGVSDVCRKLERCVRRP